MEFIVGKGAWLMPAKSGVFFHFIFLFFFFHFRPAFRRNCTSGPCEACWRVGPWKPCTAVCGRGFQSRKVDCIHTGSCKPVPDRHCVQMKPASWRHCLGPSCDSTYPSQVPPAPQKPCQNPDTSVPTSPLSHRRSGDTGGSSDSWGSGSHSTHIFLSSLLCSAWANGLG